MRIKFLIIRFSSIGDIVLTSPVVRMLKKQIPQSEIHFVTKAHFAQILAANPNIDKIHTLSRNMSDLLSELKAENFDYIIDLHNNIRSSQIKLNLNARSFTFDKLNLKKWLLTNLKINYMPDIHIVDRYITTLDRFRIRNDQEGLDYYIPPGAEFDLATLPESFRNGYIAFVIGGTYFTKRLPMNKIIEICSQVNHPVILLGGKREYDTGNLVAGAVKGDILNLCGKPGIHESASLIRQASVVLTNDTGMMHIAAAFRKKILSFWGNTVASLGMYPYMPHPASIRLEVNGLKCRPCSKLGYDKCPKGHFKCMNNIDTSLAIKWIKEHF
jgi:ADP-heptose:LPS heptosyltransferase